MRKIKDTNQVYHSHDSISASGLKIIYQKSMYHYLNQKSFNSSAMNFGSAVHSFLLEPDNKDIIVLPQDINLRLKVDREKRDSIIEKNKNKTLITYDENKALQHIIDNVHSHNLASKLLLDINEIEYSYYGKIDDIDVRVRPDGLKRNRYILDIKTCQDASPQAFKSSIYKYAYHLQACFYSEALGYDPSEFRFIAIENKYPYDVAVYSLSEDLIEKGKLAWRIAFDSYRNYKEKNIVSGFNWDTLNNDGSLIV